MLLHVYVLVDVLRLRCVFEHVLFCVRVVVAIRVYVLGDVLDFVLVLFQSGVFNYILVCGGWGGWPVVHICKTY